MFVYDPICFSLTVILRDHGKTAGDYKTITCSNIEYEYNYGNKTAEEKYKN
jgi:hypothetical protein